MVSLSEVVLNVVVFGRDAQLDKLSLERARLLKEAMHLSFNLHKFVIIRDKLAKNEER